MKRVFRLSHMVLASVALVAAFLTMQGEATAVTLNVCVPEKEGTAIVTPRAGVCEAKYTASRLLPLAEAEKLEKILSHIKYEEKGIDGKPTIQFSGVNVQVVNGEGRTFKTNGEGNLIIGYDETTGVQIGSHNLILGTDQAYYSYGGIDAGSENQLTAPFASVTGGSGNIASGEDASVSGGRENTAIAPYASVSGGSVNTATGLEATSVSGGRENVAEEIDSSITGGLKNKATGEEDASVTGGYKNNAAFAYSSIFGGKELTTRALYEAIP
jgi:hypothetical protein